MKSRISVSVVGYNIVMQCKEFKCVAGSNTIEYNGNVHISKKKIKDVGDFQQEIMKIKD